MQKSIYILDPNLRSLQGHHFEYDRSIAEAARREGIRCVVLAHREASLPCDLGLDVRPVFSSDMWKTFPGEKYHSPGNIAAVSSEFAAETFRLLDAEPIDDGSVVFLPSITKVHLPAAVEIARRFGARGATTTIMLRYQASLFDGPAASAAFGQLEEAASTSKIRLCTDSHRLAAELGGLTRLPIDVFPIPHTDQFAREASPRPQDESEGPIQMVALGDARGEKGLAEIFDAVRLAEGKPWADRVRFTLQCNHPSADVANAVSQFKADIPSGVALIDRTMPTEEYYDLVRSADVILVPYHRDIYKDRTSGIFLEGLLAGKVVIYTRDTWMSDVCDAHGGGIAIPDRSPLELCAAMERVVGSLSSYKAKAIEAAAYWRNVHSPENLLSHLFDEPMHPVIVPRKPRALIFFPWGDASLGASGASVRLNLLVSYLEQHQVEVRVMFPGEPGPFQLIGERSVAEPYAYMRMRTKALRLLLHAANRVLGGRGDESFHLWFHLWPHVDGRFKARCDELVAWADQVFVEYSYAAPVMAELCRKHQKTLSVTLHDVVSDQAAGVALIHPITRTLESGAVKTASNLFTVSAADKSEFQARGVDSKIIPHPIDTKDALPIFDQEEANAILGGLYDLPVENRRICLFVGSAYEPNRVAARAIRAMAEEIRAKPQAADLVFVVAGACHEPLEEDNFVALGRVERAALEALYIRAALILIPLKQGTGASVKSIEALARGSLVLSTTVGMRGFPVENGKHCLIEDDLQSFPQRILDALSDSEGSNAVRAEAKAFAASYGLSEVFSRYPRGAAWRAPSLDMHDRELQRRRRRAADELRPRLRAAANTKAIAILKERFELNEEDAADQAAAQLQEHAGSSTIPQDAPPPPKSSFARRFMKQIALRLPPVRGLYQNVLSANSNLREMGENVKSLENALEQARGKCGELEAELVTLKRSRESALGELAAAAAEAEGLVTQAHAAEARAHAAEARAHAAEARAGAAEAKADEAMASIAQAKRELAKAREELGEANSRLQALRREVETRALQIAACKTENAALTSAYLEQLAVSNPDAYSFLQKVQDPAPPSEAAPLPEFNIAHSMRDHAIFEWQPSADGHNFGDHLSRLIGSEIFTAGEWARICADRHTIFSLLGSTLCDYRIQTMLDTGRSPVFIGCGYRGDELAPGLLSRAAVYGCRGRLSQAALARAGVFSDVVGDPAALLPLLVPPRREKSGKTLLVPHINDPKRGEYRASAVGCDAELSPVTESIENLREMIEAISAADFVLAGAMHAAIVAYAYDVPFAFFQDDFVDCPAKWSDWLTSIGLSPADAEFHANVGAGVAWYERRRRKMVKRSLVPLLGTYRNIGAVRPKLWADALRHDLSAGGV